MNPHKVVRWNEDFGNSPIKSYDRDLEKSLLIEETNERLAAMDSDDIDGIIDGAIDTIFVLVGTLYKLGLNALEINRAFDEVCRSNRSKIGAKKDKNGKVQKGKSFRPPDFSKLVESVHNRRLQAMQRR